MDNRPSDGGLPPERFRSDVDASHLIKVKGSHRYRPAKYVCTVSVKPYEQQKVPLGNFTADKPARGFSIELRPNPHPKGSLTTRITSLGTAKRYRLTLLITNHGAKGVEAEVRQL